ncbi:bis(5'-nucleosyl)-tetraphosphatase (symmetrical) YqeK [Lagierella sp.]|uniref:bis(5'-nucleosyl)-tetraphosphatase (symmetrical) YqeK n=1 Tax=Lagierella sp. TaxID=2849657 RepID=UPI00263289DC|nr:bis(5'-nucleosyl)-tetraphosphatase (symmetrical) YqeK [Lagierella sp.]
MINKEDIVQDLKLNLSKERFQHSLSVAKKAVELAENFGLDIKKCQMAGLLHDCAKGLENHYEEVYKMDYEVHINRKENEQYKNPYLKHCLLGMIVAKNKYKVEDFELLKAIKEHTTGSVGMSELGKVLYLADKTEDMRDYKGVDEIRRLSLIDMDRAIVLSLNNTIVHLIYKNRIIAPESVELRNYLLGGTIEGN